MASDSAHNKKWTLSELAVLVGGCAKGNLSKTVTHVAELQNATSDSITHCSNLALSRFLKTTSAGIVILSEGRELDYEGDRLIAKNSRVAFALVVKALHELPNPLPGIHESAIIDESSIVGDTARIEANVVIGNSVRIGERVVIGAGTILADNICIGEGTKLDSNVTVYSGCTIGKDCNVSAGVVIGASGFSYEWDGERWVSVQNIGAVVIGNEVDIGASTSIDRGSIRNTCIGNGVKIDNNVQIGHNVEIGEHSMIVGNVGIAGSVKIGRRCIVGGQSAIASHVNVVDDVVIQAASLVTKSLTEPGTYSSSLPARKASDWKRTLSKLNKLQSSSS